MGEVVHGMLRGLGLIADAYVAVSVLLAAGALEHLGLVTPVQAMWLVALYGIGNLCGLLLFGLSGRRLCRRKMLLCTGLIMSVVGVLCSVVAFPSVRIAYVTWLMPCFSALGFAVGGDFTLTATAPFVHSSTPRSIAAAFAMQGLGRLLAPCLMLLLLHFLAANAVR